MTSSASDFKKIIQNMQNIPDIIVTASGWVSAGASSYYSWTVTFNEVSRYPSFVISQKPLCNSAPASVNVKNPNILPIFGNDTSLNYSYAWMTVPASPGNDPRYFVLKSKSINFSPLSLLKFVMFLFLLC